MAAFHPAASSTFTPLPVLDGTALFSGAALDELAAARLAALMRVLADPARLRILSLLQAQPCDSSAPGRPRRSSVGNRR